MPLAGRDRADDEPDDQQHRVQSGAQDGRPCLDDARWSLPLDGTELLPVYPALYEVLGDIPHFPVGVL